MNLGALMSHLESETGAEAALEALGDVVLFARIRSVGEAFEEAPGTYVANASGRFARLASDEDWLSLMGAMEREADPGRTALTRMLRWALERDEKEIAGLAPATADAGGCSCGGGAGGCHDAH